MQLAHGQLLVHQDPQVLLHSAVPQQVSPRLCWYLGLFLHRCRTLCLPVIRDSVKRLAEVEVDYIHYFSLICPGICLIVESNQAGQL
ncbi:hypothetical protein RLOC_00008181 [Lonchura striata]|uniref:Uncharacterized protein n=1 Tax=Lonchura striata TaxID=40157 RepID=A0A218V9Y1_9PASE|nr:hypothetical protein RLOC_00008181 [Lonchura striata domestica]